MSPELDPRNGRRDGHLGADHPDGVWPTRPYDYGPHDHGQAPPVPDYLWQWGSGTTPPPLRMTIVDFSQKPNWLANPHTQNPNCLVNPHTQNPPQAQQQLGGKLEWRWLEGPPAQQTEASTGPQARSSSTDHTPDQLITRLPKGPFARFAQMWRNGDMSNPVTELASRHPRTTRTLAAAAILAVSYSVFNGVSGDNLGSIGNQITRAISSERPDPVPPEIALGNISEIFPLGEKDVYGVYTTSSLDIEIPYRTTDSEEPQLVRNQGALPVVEVSSVDPIILRHEPKDPSSKTLTIQTLEDGKVKVVINWNNFRFNMPILMQNNGSAVDIGWQEPIIVSMNARHLFTAEELKAALPNAAEGELDRLTPITTASNDLAQILAALEKLGLAEALSDQTCFGSSETLVDQLKARVSKQIIDALGKSNYTEKDIEVVHEGQPLGPLDDLLKDPVMPIINNPAEVGLKLTPISRTCYTVDPSKMEGYVND